MITDCVTQQLQIRSWKKSKPNFFPYFRQDKKNLFFIEEMESLLCHFDETTSAILTTDEDVMSCVIHYREILQEMELVNDKMRKQIDDFYVKTDDLRKQKM